MAEKINSIDKAYSSDIIELDCAKVSKIFNDLKKKGILRENVKYYDEESMPPSKDLLKSQDFIDNIKYYRMLQNKSQRKMAKEIGVNCETYRQYELKNFEIQKSEIAEKMIQVLDIEDKIKLPDYFKIMKQYPIDKIKNMIMENTSKEEFSQETGISLSTINTWFQKDFSKSLSTDTYKKITKYLKDKINYKNIQIENQEEME